jgi:hypothetical protein
VEAEVKLGQRVRDALKRRKPQTVEPEPRTEPPRRLVGDARREGPSPAGQKSKTRPHHYFFAHRALRDTFFESPHRFVRALLARKAELLHVIWDDVGEWAEDNLGTAARLPSDGLALTIHQINPLTVALIISLPPPEQMVEAHFVGLILGPKVTRFVTLERGRIVRSSRVRTVLCEWQGQKHANYGDGPEATVEAFARTLSDMVEREGEYSSICLTRPGSSA